MHVKSALEKTDSFDGLLNVASHTTPHLSFWGKQYLVVDGYEGILELDSLFDRVHEIEKGKNYTYSDGEFALGKHLITVLHKISTVADFQLYLCNLLTLFFAALRTHNPMGEKLNRVSEKSIFVRTK